MESDETLELTSEDDYDLYEKTTEYIFKFKNFSELEPIFNYESDNDLKHIHLNINNGIIYNLKYDITFSLAEDFHEMIELGNAKIIDNEFQKIIYNNENVFKKYNLKNDFSIKFEINKIDDSDDYINLIKHMNNKSDYISNKEIILPFNLIEKLKSYNLVSDDKTKIYFSKAGEYDIIYINNYLEPHNILWISQMYGITHYFFIISFHLILTEWLNNTLHINSMKLNKQLNFKINNFLKYILYITKIIYNKLSIITNLLDIRLNDIFEKLSNSLLVPNITKLDGDCWLNSLTAAYYYNIEKNNGNSLYNIIKYLYNNSNKKITIDNLLYILKYKSYVEKMRLKLIQSNIYNNKRKYISNNKIFDLADLLDNNGLKINILLHKYLNINNYNNNEICIYTDNNPHAIFKTVEDNFIKIYDLNSLHDYFIIKKEIINPLYDSNISFKCDSKFINICNEYNKNENKMIPISELINNSIRLSRGEYALYKNKNDYSKILYTLEDIKVVPFDDKYVYEDEGNKYYKDDFDDYEIKIISCLEYNKYNNNVIFDNNAINQINKYSHEKGINFDKYNILNTILTDNDNGILNNITNEDYFKLLCNQYDKDLVEEIVGSIFETTFSKEWCYCKYEKYYISYIKLAIDNINFDNILNNIIIPKIDINKYISVMICDDIYLMGIPYNSHLPYVKKELIDVINTTKYISNKNPNDMEIEATFEPYDEFIIHYSETNDKYYIFNYGDMNIKYTYSDDIVKCPVMSDFSYIINDFYESMYYSYICSVTSSFNIDRSIYYVNDILKWDTYLVDSCERKIYKYYQGLNSTINYVNVFVPILNVRDNMSNQHHCYIAQILEYNNHILFDGGENILEKSIKSINLLFIMFIILIIIIIVVIVIIVIRKRIKKD